LLLPLLVAACGSTHGPARLSLQWTTDDALAGAVTPTESVRSVVIVRNEGGVDLENVALHFNQQEAGQLPLGISVGTVTNLSSRFEGDDQVWDLGGIGAGDTVLFPMTLWFEAASRTAEPTTVRLLMVASSSSLADEVESNYFEVQVDARQATGR
jgi:hypothetical protein